MPLIRCASSSLAPGTISTRVVRAATRSGVAALIRSRGPGRSSLCDLSAGVAGSTLLNRTGSSAARFYCRPDSRWGKAVLWGLLFVYGLAAPVIQSWLLNFHLSSDPANPYVYAHTDKDVFKMVDSVQKAVQASDDGVRTPVYVIARGTDYWPLPWYLRGFPHVGYYHEVPDDCDVLVIAGPWNAFTSGTWNYDAIESFSRKHAKLVHDYLERGGRALIMMDPVAPYQRRRVRPLLDLLRERSHTLVDMAAGAHWATQHRLRRHTQPQR